MNFYPQRMWNGRKRTKILSPVLQAAMTTTYLCIPVTVVTREVGVEGADRGRGVPHPATIVEPDDESILELFKHLGIEQKFAARMINVEQFMSSSDQVSPENR